MDSVTQFLLGAAVGEAVAGRKVGNRAVVWGGVAGTIPDLDILANLFMDTVSANAFHRTVTHSILFSLVLAPILGFALKKIYRNKGATFKDWTLLFFLAFITHILLDCFTTWGTQIFWPFNDYRVAFRSIFVIDPLYTVPLLVTIVWLMFLPRQSQKRERLNQIGLIISSTYLLVTLLVKYHVNNVFESSFENQNFEVIRYNTKPTPFNIILWSAIVETEKGYYTGLYSFFDSNKIIDYDYFEKNHEVLSYYNNNGKVQKLLTITNGWYTVKSAENGVVINDLRFGMLSGWQSDGADFAFSYQIYHNEGNVVIKEVPQDIEQAKKMLGPLIQRIFGENL